MFKNEKWTYVLNSELAPKDLILSYANHIEYCLIMKINPCVKEKFLKKTVCSSFPFRKSKEGSDFWMFLLRFEIVGEKEIKEEYLKEKKKAYYRGLFPALLFSISALIFLITLIYLLSYL
jgi:hypothetical protein